METTDSLALIAARIQQAWEAQRICSLIGGGCRSRVVHIGRLVEAGELDAGAALRMAREAEGVAFCFAPLRGDVP